MLRTTLGQLLVADALPEDMRRHDFDLDKGGLHALLRDLAVNHPEQYREVSKKLADIGRDVATASGGFGVGVEHLSKSPAGRRQTQQLQAKLQKILDDDNLTDQQRHQLIIRAAGANQAEQRREVYEESLKEGNPLALQIASGARGNQANLASLRSSDRLYTDQHDHVIPVPVLRSYSEGLTPVEYWAGSYGARKGVIDVKSATRDAGYFGKQLNQVSHRLMVVDEDDEEPSPTLRGLPVDTDDVDNEGSLLAHDVGGYQRNTVLTPKIMKELRRRGHERILVRSPITGTASDGIYARDAGVRERGRLPGRGEMIGLTAAQSLSEPVSQSQLASKHAGGVAGQSKGVSGFEAINSLVQTAKTIKGGGTHSEVDGVVQTVKPAPAGGSIVLINNQEHYVPAGLDLKVKKGDTVEAGDMVSDGLPNMAKIVQHKGIGEAGRFFTQAARQAMRDAGLKPHRRNLELLARGLINHVRLNDEYGDYAPDDVVPYAALAGSYVPRPGHQVVSVGRAALGKYLEAPVLHHTIGTKVRPSVLKDLEHFGVKEVTVHSDAPPFDPEMIRGMASLQHDPDWLTRMYGSGQKASLLDAVHRGGTSDASGTSFVPGLAKAVDFGRIGQVRAPEPSKSLPPEGTPLGAKTLPTAPPKKQAPQPSLATRLSSLFKFGHVKKALPTEPPLPAKPAGGAPQQPHLQPIKPDFGTSTTMAPTPTATGTPAVAPGGMQPQRPYQQPYQAPRLSGYQPAQQSMLQRDPEQFANFVRGGDFGGFMGQAMRFAGGLDSNALATLTSGSRYAGQRQQQFGGYGQPGQRAGPWQGGGGYGAEEPDEYSTAPSTVPASAPTVDGRNWMQQWRDHYEKLSPLKQLGIGLGGQAAGEQVFRTVANRLTGGAANAATNTVANATGQAATSGLGSRTLGFAKGLGRFGLGTLAGPATYALDISNLAGVNPIGDRFGEGLASHEEMSQRAEAMAQAPWYARALAGPVTSWWTGVGVPAGHVNRARQDISVTSEQEQAARLAQQRGQLPAANTNESASRLNQATGAENSWDVLRHIFDPHRMFQAGTEGKLEESRQADRLRLEQQRDTNVLEPQRLQAHLGNYRNLQQLHQRWQNAGSPGGSTWTDPKTLQQYTTGQYQDYLRMRDDRVKALLGGVRPHSRYSAEGQMLQNQQAHPHYQNLQRLHNAWQAAGSPAGAGWRDPTTGEVYDTAKHRDYTSFQQQLADYRSKVETALHQ